MTTPGLVYDLPDETYHADPALSASGAKLLLPPSCPALYKHRRETGPEYRAEFDFGHAAHAKVLGAGAEIVIVNACDWRTKAAKEQRDAIRAEGKIPLLPEEAARVDGMAAALRAHPVASVLLDPEAGRPEVSAFWRDERHGIDRRVRFDFLPDTDGGRMLLPDYKSAACSAPAVFGPAAFRYSYPLQAAFYSDAIRAFDLAEDLAFLFIAQEKTPPYLVTVFQLDAASLRIGREDTDRACATFADCSATDTWPGYSEEIEVISPPGYIARQYEDVLA
jgi:hypothetical protein